MLNLRFAGWFCRRMIPAGLFLHPLRAIWRKSGVLYLKWELSGWFALHYQVVMHAAPLKAWSWLHLTGLQGLQIKGLPVVWGALKSQCALSSLRGELLRSSKVCQSRRGMQLSPDGGNQ